MTIDLEARPAAAKAGADTPETPQSKPEQQPKPQSGSGKQAAGKPADTAEATAKDKPEEKSAAPDKGAKIPASDAPSAASAPGRPDPAIGKAAERQSAGDRPVQPAGKSSFPLIAAALIGGAVSLAGAIGLDRYDIVDLFADGSSGTEIADLRAELAAANAKADGLRSELTEKIAALTPGDAVPAQDFETVRAQIESLQAEISRTANQAAAPDLAPLAARLDKLETLIGSGASGREVALATLEARLAASDLSIKALQAEMENRSPDPALAALRTDLTGGLDALKAEQADLKAQLASRVSGLEKAVEAASEKAQNAPTAEAVQDAAEIAATASRKAEQAVALAPVLAAESLQRNLDAGASFEAALTAFANLDITDPALTALQPYAAQGLPTRAALEAEFAALAAGFQAAPAEPESEPSGPMDRLLKGAFSVVKVSPVEPQPGDGSQAIVSRIKAALAANDMAAALREWQALPDDKKTASKAWADKVEAVQLARTFSDTVRAEALARLNATQ